MAQTSAKKTTFDAQTKLQIRASVRQKASLSARRLCSSIDGQRLQMLISRERKNLMVLPASRIRVEVQTMTTPRFLMAPFFKRNFVTFSNFEERNKCTYVSCSLLWILDGPKLGYAKLNRTECTTKLWAALCRHRRRMLSSDASCRAHCTASCPTKKKAMSKLRSIWCDWLSYT